MQTTVVSRSRRPPAAEESVDRPLLLPRSRSIPPNKKPASKHDARTKIDMPPKIMSAREESSSPFAFGASKGIALSRSLPRCLRVFAVFSAAAQRDSSDILSRFISFLCCCNHIFFSSPSTNQSPPLLLLLQNRARRRQRALLCVLFQGLFCVVGSARILTHTRTHTQQTNPTPRTHLPQSAACRGIRHALAHEPPLPVPTAPACPKSIHSARSVARIDNARSIDPIDPSIHPYQPNHFIRPTHPSGPTDPPPAPAAASPAGPAAAGRAAPPPPPAPPAPHAPAAAPGCRSSRRPPRPGGPSAWCPSPRGGTASVLGGVVCVGGHAEASGGASIIPSPE